MTAERARPWWASPSSVDDLDPAEDPVEASRASRRPQQDAPRTGPEQRDGNPDEQRDGRPGAQRHGKADEEPGGKSEEDPEPAAHDPACSACPLCAGWRALTEHHPEVAAHLAAAGRHLADARPEVTAHLAAAGQHLLAAVREALDDVGPGEEASSDAPFERIDLDVDDRPERRR